MGWSGVVGMLALVALGVGAWVATRPAVGWFAYSAMADGPLPLNFYLLTGRRVFGLVLVAIGLLAFGGVIGHRLGRRRTT
jgi:hypothetical protein